MPTRNASDSSVPSAGLLRGRACYERGEWNDAFEALASVGIDIQLVSTSEIKIACVVAEDRAEDAVRVLHRAFGLAG